MGVVESFLNLLIIFLIVNGIFNYFISIRARKIAQQMGEDSLKAGLEIKEDIELATDHICGSLLPKKEAYILTKDNQKYYFCSWECREKFIAGSEVGDTGKRI